MALTLPQNNVELLRALKRMGINPETTQRVVIDIKSNDVPTVYVQGILPDAHELVIALEDGDFNVLWQTAPEVTNGSL